MKPGLRWHNLVDSKKRHLWHLNRESQELSDPKFSYGILAVINISRSWANSPGAPRARYIKEFKEFLEFNYNLGRTLETDEMKILLLLGRLVYAREKETVEKISGQIEELLQLKHKRFIPDLPVYTAAGNAQGD